MLVERITETEEAIFAALATFRYVTAYQLMRLGVTKAKPHLYETLRSLKIRKPAVIKELDFGTLVRHGRLPRIYALTPYGAEILQEARADGSVVDAPKRVRIFNTDYFHRVNCVDFHIALHVWARDSGAHIDFYDTYYDPMAEAGGGYLRQKTQLRLKNGVIVPDALFAFTTGDGTKRLYALEMYNGRKTLRVEKQLALYVVTINEEAIERAFSYDHAVRILCIFDDPEGLRLVGERVRQQNTLGSDADYFFTKTLDEVRVNFLDDWGTFDGERLPLF